MTEAPLLEVCDLETEFVTEGGVVKAVDSLSFTLDRGETYGIVGESGAGKSVTALSILRLIDSPGRIVGGEIRYKGEDLLAMSEREIRSVRGNDIAMIFQDPMTALNPAYTVGEQIVDVILEHEDVSRAAARERTVSLFEDVGIPDAAERIDDYPHQFSGGMRQRALIAMALSCNPELIIADEPTTALDVTIQAQILDLLDDLQDEYDTGILLITHNMGVIAQMCDRVGVFYAGGKIEEGTLHEVFEAPRHPYTVGLLKSIPRIDDPRHRIDAIPGNMPNLTEVPQGCSFRDRCEFATPECAESEPPPVPVGDGSGHVSACLRISEIDFEAASRLEPQGTAHPERTRSAEPLLEVDHLRKYFDPESQSWYNKLFGERQYVHAVDDVSLDIRRGETLGLVGESGCGKTTLGRAIARLYEPDEGTVLFAGTDVTALGRRELKRLREDLQVVFQDPFSSLNPRRTVRNIIGRPLEIHGKVADEEAKEARVIELLEMVGLQARHIGRYPHEFSGGQKQRIGVARALAVEPEFIVLDEPVSALDVSVQAQVINLLMDLQEELDLTYLFISHDLNVVQHIADRIAVMYLGELVEVGTVDEVFGAPYHPYTESLLSAIPQPTPGDRGGRIVLEGTVPSAIEPPSGCRFHTRCPYAMPECETDDPRTAEMGDGHQIDCHLFDEAVMAGKDESPADVIERQRRTTEAAEAADD